MSHSAMQCIADLGNNSLFDDSNEHETNPPIKLALILFMCILSK